MTRFSLALWLFVAVVIPVLAQDAPAPKIKAVDRQKIRETKETMRKLSGELKTAKSMLQGYPETLDELIKNQLIEKLPKDGWDRDFVYARNKETGYELKCLGADGKAGGAAADADIIYTQDGQLLTLTADQAAALAAKRLEQKQLAFKVLALAEMRVVGRLAVQFRRDKSTWPEKTADFKPAGEAPEEKAVALCFDDPWGRAYGFKALPNENFAVTCLGDDGVEGGTGSSSDYVVTERDVRTIEDPERGWRGGWDRAYDWHAEDLAEGVRRFKKTNKRLPTELGELTRGAPRIRNDIPMDRFGGEYLYITLSDEEFYVIALGSDKRPGGMGDGQDVVSPTPGQVAIERRDDTEDFAPKANPEESDENKALVAVAEIQMQDLIQAANAFQKEKKAWPATLDDLKDRLPGKTVPKDPWDNDFEFEQLKDAKGEVTGVRVLCRGCDKAIGGLSAASDFSYDNSGERKVIEAAEKPAPPAPNK